MTLGGPLLIEKDAVKTINEVHNAGGKILEFVSYCGGRKSFFSP